MEVLDKYNCPLPPPNRYISKDLSILQRSKKREEKIHLSSPQIMFTVNMQIWEADVWMVRSVYCFIPWELTWVSSCWVSFNVNHKQTNKQVKNFKQLLETNWQPWKLLESFKCQPILQTIGMCPTPPNSCVKAITAAPCDDVRSEISGR